MGLGTTERDECLMGGRIYLRLTCLRNGHLYMRWVHVCPSATAHESLALYELG